MRVVIAATLGLVLAAAMPAHCAPVASLQTRTADVCVPFVPPAR
jgi:hypothetical protein